VKATCLALIHHPVYNHNGQVVTTAVTNLDVHDLARLALTFGCERYFVVTPLELQQKLVRRLIRHWISGRGAEYNQTRRQAFELVEPATSLEEVRRKIEDVHGEAPKVVATTARSMNGAISYEEMKRKMNQDPGVWLILFGTGWGLSREFIEKEADCILEPISPDAEYNHLSVRSAAAIILDRVFRECL